MARKTAIVAVPRGGAWEKNRDSIAGRVYKLTEFSSLRAEKFGTRAMLMLENTGARIPEHAKGLGMVGLAIVGLNVFLSGNIRFEVLEPLMDEMMECVESVRDPRDHPEVATPLVSDDDIEEVQTRLWLRSEIIRLHTDFSVADDLFRWISEVRSSSADSLDTPTSPPT